MKKFIVFLLAFALGLPAAYAEGGDGGEDKDNVRFSALSPYVLFMDMNTGRVLYEKNADEKIYPASTVKIMTVVLALENCNLEDKATAGQAALDSVPDGVTTMNLMPGESLTVRQLIYGAMLASAADATNVLGEAVSGSVGEFVKLMNKKAKELGMNDTNFSNTHGEHDDRTYTTVRDMAVLARYAMENQDFREIVKTDQYTIQPTEKYKEERSLVNSNYMVSRVKRSDYYYSKAIGIKAGYTQEAGSCLIEAAKNNDMELLALTFGSSTVDGKAQGYVDCKNFFETAFKNYKTRIIVSKGKLLDQIPIKNAKRAGQVLLEAEENLYYIYPIDEESADETFEITRADYVKAPVKKGDVIGSVEYFYDGKSVGTVNLVADKDYKFDAISFVGEGIVRVVTSPLFIIGLIAVIFIIIYVCVKKRRKRLLRQKRMRERKRREAGRLLSEDNSVGAGKRKDE